jgi:biotin carboxylase
VPNPLDDGPTLVCLASFFKGTAFLEAARAAGARVVLVTRERSRDEDWPRDALDETIVLPDAAPLDGWIDAICALARRRRIARLVALEEYDVLTAASIREHLRLDGMGTSAARLFRDKLAMRVEASRAGIPVPRFVAVLEDDALRRFMRDTPAPWVLKPRTDVSAIGIRTLHDAGAALDAIAALDARPVLTERASYFLLEQFVAGEVFHVDSLVDDGRVVFAVASRYRRPPMDVAHHGGVFVSSTVSRGSEEERALLHLNARVLAALGMTRGATHAEFIRGAADGQLYFLEVAARVGGAHIAEMVEAASGVNSWREWARLELSSGERPYTLPPTRAEHAGIALALARQEWPDTSAFADPEIVFRPRKRHHVGLVVRSPSHDRVQELLDAYVGRFTEEFLAVLPPRQRAE